MSNNGAENVYSDRYVAFIDILGFSQIVRESVTSPEQAKKLISILNNTANASVEYGEEAGIDRDDFRTQSFSDCIVLSENASPIGLFHLLAAATAPSL